MKILLDMNIPLRFAKLLTQSGFDVLLWSDVGAPNALDSEIMLYARENDLIVLTYDLDFSTILSVTHELKPSVIQIRASVVHAERAVELLKSAILQHEEDLKKGAVLSIDINKSRLRILPI
ncbi:MAG: DUF5615 family PIN-like protein [Oscillospiraceae bacterium]|nr:DUF5615 family PIN-like protein [Oscillospiraceae bacterium]